MSRNFVLFLCVTVTVSSLILSLLEIEDNNIGGAWVFGFMLGVGTSMTIFVFENKKRNYP